MPTYCSLNDAYGSSWNSKPIVAKTVPQQAQQKQEDEKKEKAFQAAQQPPSGSGEKSFCPNCKNCLENNNKFQQSVIDTAIRPLPRWVPQNENIGTYDPYNRYFASHENFENTRESFMNMNTRENFGNISVTNGEKMLQLILYLLIALFIIQLFEFIGSVLY